MADGLVEVWPAIEKNSQLAESLRANAAAMAVSAPAALWNREGDGSHAVLFRSGRSLAEAGLVGPAILYYHYQQLLDEAEPRLGPGHPDTLASRNNLAYAYRSAGKLDQAIPLHEQTLTDRERVLGPDHPNTLTTRNNLAGAYKRQRKLDQAIPRHEH